MRKIACGFVLLVFSMALMASAQGAPASLTLPQPQSAVSPAPAADPHPVDFSAIFAAAPPIQMSSLDVALLNPAFTGVCSVSCTPCPCTHAQGICSFRCVTP
jgi:hypothetical protein